MKIKSSLGNFNTQSSLQITDSEAKGRGKAVKNVVESQMGHAGELWKRKKTRK